MQAVMSVSYPSTVSDVVVEICIMHLWGMLNIDEENPSSRNEYAKGVCSGGDNVVGSCE